MQNPDLAHHVQAFALVVETLHILMLQPVQGICSRRAISSSGFCQFKRVSSSASRVSRVCWQTGFTALWNKETRVRKCRQSSSPASRKECVLAISASRGRCIKIVPQRTLTGSGRGSSQATGLPRSSGSECRICRVFQVRPARGIGLITRGDQMQATQTN